MHVSDGMGWPRTLNRSTPHAYTLTAAVHGAIPPVQRGGRGDLLPDVGVRPRTNRMWTDLVTRGRQRLARLDDPLQRLRTRDVRWCADRHVRHAYRLHLTYRLHPRLRSSWPCDQPPGHATARRVAASLRQVAAQPS